MFGRPFEVCAPVPGSRPSKLPALAGNAGLQLLHVDVGEHAVERARVDVAVAPRGRHALEVARRRGGVGVVVRLRAGRHVHRRSCSRRHGRTPARAASNVARPGSIWSYQSGAVISTSGGSGRVAGAHERVHGAVHVHAPVAEDLVVPAAGRVALRGRRGATARRCRTARSGSGPCRSARAPASHDGSGCSAKFTSSACAIAVDRARGHDLAHLVRRDHARAAVGALAGGVVVERALLARVQRRAVDQARHAGPAAGRVRGAARRSGSRP